MNFEEVKTQIAQAKPAFPVQIIHRQMKDQEIVEFIYAKVKSIFPARIRGNEDLNLLLKVICLFFCILLINI